MRECVGLWRDPVLASCDVQGEDHQQERKWRRDVGRVLAGHQRVHEPALQQWSLVARLC